MIRVLWQLPQILLSLFVIPFSDRKIIRRIGNVRVLTWKYSSGLSLGLFIFVPRTADVRMIAHEYGHTRQSLKLGVLYLIVIGLPSFMWAVMKDLGLFSNIDYFSFYTEKWAEKEGSVLIS